ncbi:GNAT family N-acetyltransferase [uncultured Roseovarius sp.]|uniref:GNAT family N-acetyltransferase n=1 Tax=uncultured Roseovarius sp. TaxID=293344 RepID=UPI002637E127|nr:GNAT family N-acetyltransferase [uncultured Roseovarius sp.]
MRLTLDPELHPPPAPALMQQCPEYGRALRAIGVKVHTARIVSGADVMAQALVVERRFGPLRVSWIPRGPVCAPTLGPETGIAIYRALRRARPHDLWLIGGTPAERAQLASAGCRQLARAQHHALLDLRAPSADRFASLHGKWRNRLRAARRTGLVIRERAFDPLLDAGMLARERVQRRALGYRGLPAAFTTAYASQTPGAARLWSAWEASHCIATMLILTHDRTATYHIGWSGGRGRALSAHHLLLWQISEHLARRGFAWLDLGLIDAQHLPGLTRFKQRSGATVAPGDATYVGLPRFALFHRRHTCAA